MERDGKRRRRVWRIRVQRHTLDRVHSLSIDHAREAIFFYNILALMFDIYENDEFKILV